MIPIKKTVNKIAYSLQAKLSRKIVLWIFASILAIETIVFIPSSFRRKQELLSQLEAVTAILVNWLANSQSTPELEPMLLDKVENNFQQTTISGIAIYRENGELIRTLGEQPAISWKDLQNQQIVRRMYWYERRYDIGWSHNYLGVDYNLVIRHDATSVERKLIFYSLRIAVLVIVISAFVTLFMIVVLGITAIAPILGLRNDLQAAASALNKQRQQVHFYSDSVQRNDELGEVMAAFQDMFDRIYTEIEQRKSVEKCLREEQEKSERLLLNIFPEPIAERLKQGQQNIADEFTEVTILFADIVGFTELSTRVPPDKLVIMLNDIFSRFDRLTETWGLEKIKTIGDAYMVVGGLPNRSAKHAEAVAEMALAMQQEMQLFASKYEETCSLRIGIHTGPVIAGVIGVKKFVYDLWGDTVNVASRMESHGFPGCIQVTATTYDFLRERYHLEKRGQIAVKGRGEMVTYWLLGRKSNEIDGDIAISNQI